MVQFIDSYNKRTPALRLQNHDPSVRDGLLIEGVDYSGGLVLSIYGNGNIVANDIISLGNINGVNINAMKFNITCDKNAKENFSSINPLEILDNLARMPIQSWKYKGDSTSVRHIGPTVQDFQAAFGLNGDDDVHISSVDLHGIALAAIQGLNEKIANLETRLSALESKG
ncbi:TPA: tail fiber domain-containing protein [Bacillus cereus]